MTIAISSLPFRTVLEILDYRGFKNISAWTNNGGIGGENHFYRNIMHLPKLKFLILAFGGCGYGIVDVKKCADDLTKIINSFG